jgi:hypothetical protein
MTVRKKRDERRLWHKIQVSSDMTLTSSHKANTYVGGSITVVIVHKIERNRKKIPGTKVAAVISKYRSIIIYCTQDL